MAATLNDNFKKAVGRANVEPIVHVSIALDTAYNFHNGGGNVDSSVTGDPVLSSITTVSRSVDPVSRAVQYGACAIEIVDDGRLRGLIGTEYPYSKEVNIKLGTPELALSDYVLIFSGTVQAVTPSEGYITIDCKTFDFLTANYATWQTMVNVHPFEAVKRILESSGIDSSNIDTTAFTPATYADSVSHYVYSSWRMYDADGFGDGMAHTEQLGGLAGLLFGMGANPTQPNSGSGNIQLQTMRIATLAARSFIDEVMRLTRTTMFVDSDGKMTLTHYDDGAAAVKHLTTDDYQDFKQSAEPPQVYNRVKINFPSYGEDHLIVNEANSQARYGVSLLSTGANYLAPANNLLKDFDGTLVVAPNPGSFAGSRDLHGSPPSDATITASRPFYGLYQTRLWKTVDVHGKWTPVNAPSGFTHLVNHVRNYNADGEATTPTVVAGAMTLNTITDVIGTGTSVINEVDLFIDATAAYDYSQYILGRFANGAPVLEVHVGLDHLDLELGDLVTLDNDVFFDHGQNISSLDSTIKFEVIQREVTPIGDSVGIKLVLCYATQDVVISLNKDEEIAGPYAGTGKGPDTQPMVLDMLEGCVESGCEVTHQTGTVYNIGAGVMSLAGGQHNIKEDYEVTATDDVDTYVGYVPGAGGFRMIEVATGSPEPGTYFGEIRLAKIAAADANLTITDRRRFGIISAKQIDKTLMSPGPCNVWNGDFKVWPNTTAVPTAWTADTGRVVTDFSREDSTVHEGDYALKVENTSTAVVLYTDKIPINNAKVYRCSGWYRQAAAFSMQLIVYWWKADKTASSTATTSIHNANLASTGSYLNLSGIVEPPSDAAYASIRVGRAASPGNVGYIDHVCLYDEPVSFKATGAVTTSLTVKSANTVVCNTEVTDYGSNYNNSNGRFTAPSAGVYMFRASGYISAYVGALTYVLATIKKNGSTALAQGYGRTIGSGSDIQCEVVSGPVELAAGDYVEFIIHPEIQTSATLATTAALTWFSGRQIS